MRDTDSVLVVVAHPDDEVLGCGGTMARLAQEGHEVRVAILAEGMTSRSPQRELADPKQLQHLHQQARQAADKLHVNEVVVASLPDNRLDTVPLLEVVKLVEDLIEKFGPEVIYTHHPGDLNVDHGVVHRAVLTATRPMPGHKVREIFAFEVLPRRSGRSIVWSLPSGRTSSSTSAGLWRLRSPRSRVTNRRRESFPIPARPKPCLRSRRAGAASPGFKRRKPSS
ncbi:MAG: PIG-L deacetylase family protein [Terriglobales bacterium]